MADLTTLDPASPPDSEIVGNGAFRMREERTDIIGWAKVEHSLSGAHAFHTGDGTFPALPAVPAPGTIGRIFIDTINKRFLLDTGSLWVTQSTVKPYFVSTPGTTVLTNAFQLLAGIQNINIGAGNGLLVIAGMLIQDSSAVADIVDSNVVIDGPSTLFPGDQFYSVSLSTPQSVIVLGFHANPTVGNRIIGLQAKKTTVNSNVTTANNPFMMAFVY